MCGWEAFFSFYKMTLLECSLVMSLQNAQFIALQMKILASHIWDNSFGMLSWWMRCRVGANCSICRTASHAEVICSLISQRGGMQVFNVMESLLILDYWPCFVFYNIWDTIWWYVQLCKTKKLKALESTDWEVLTFYSFGIVWSSFVISNRLAQQRDKLLRKTGNVINA